MASNLKMEIEKFNGQSFELWKLKMEDLLVDRDQWIAVDPGTAPTGTVAALYTLGLSWKKSSIHLVCPWGQVLSQGVVT